MRVGVVIVTHYALGSEFLQALRLIIPDAPEYVAVSLDPKQSVDEMRDLIETAIRGANEGEGVLVLTDMFGGTPSNVALSFLDDHPVEVVTGINLPMLIKLAPEQYRRDNDMKTAITAAHEAGKKYINVASWVLSGEQNA